MKLTNQTNIKIYKRKNKYKIKRVVSSAIPFFAKDTIVVCHHGCGMQIWLAGDATALGWGWIYNVTLVDMGVSTNRGIPKWMVYKMENPIKIDALGVPLFLETPI